MARRAADAPEPAGFGNCAVCPYRSGGTVAICYECASKTLEKLAADKCDLCDRKLGDDPKCKNPLCTRPVEQRGWDFIYAISMRSGALRKAINAYKYDGKWGWGIIFGRVLVGYLQALEDAFRTYDLIIPMPTYVGRGGRDRDHTAFVIERAGIEDDSWPFRTDVMRKTKPTKRLADVKGGFGARALVAELEIRPALKVVDPDAVKGSSVLVFDDVFTGGLTLREVSGELVAHGATDISGIVLARQPYG